MLGTTEPEMRGPARNPWNLAHCDRRLERRLGGGGRGALGADRRTRGDGGGSIRIPASACGLFGLKPTRARNPIGPEVGEGWSGFVAEGACSRQRARHRGDARRDARSRARLTVRSAVLRGLVRRRSAPRAAQVSASRSAPGRSSVARRTPIVRPPSTTRRRCARASATRSRKPLRHSTRRPRRVRTRDHRGRASARRDRASRTPGAAAAPRRRLRADDVAPRPGRPQASRDRAAARARDDAAAGRDLGGGSSRVRPVPHGTLAYPPMRRRRSRSEAWERARLVALRHVAGRPRPT